MVADHILMEQPKIGEEVHILIILAALILLDGVKLLAEIHSLDYLYAY